MPYRENSIVTVLVALLLASLPALADSWTTFPQPDFFYTAFTTNFGGGDGSLNFITSLGPFTFSNPQSENNVPNSWATWNCPPATESCTPNVLFNEGFSTLTITTSDIETIMGFELEPEDFAVETVDATFHSSTGDSFTLRLSPNGSAGALLFAARDTTSGAHITSVDITDEAGDDFAIAQVREGACRGCVCGGAFNGCEPAKPSTLLLLATGLVASLGAIRSRMKF